MSKRKEFKLKKCPFKHPAKYGKRQAVSVVFSNSFSSYDRYVLCLICDAYGPSALTDYWAIKKWNERIR